jgi:tetratricopeptide (TPR) repeat protein
VGLGLLHLSIVRSRLGRFEEAIAINREARRQLRATGDRRPATRALGNLGFLCYQAGDDEQALACFRQSLAQAEQSGARLDMARTLATLTLLHHRRGEEDAALECIDQALALLAEHGPRAFHDALLLEKAEVLVALGQHDAAQPLVEAGTAAMIRLGHPDHVVQGRVLLARIMAARGDAAGAVAALEALLGEAGGPGSGPGHGPEAGEGSEAEIGPGPVLGLGAAAPVRLELWRLTGDEGHRRAAIAGYEGLYRESPEHDHRLKLEALGARVPAPA